MDIVFVSNYINHHQLPFCNAMHSYGGDVSFFFIQTIPMEEKRRQMGWELDEDTIPYVIKYYIEKDKCEKLILDSDVVLFGWTEGITGELEEKRFFSGKLSFRVSERIYREGQWKFLSPRGLVSKYHEHIKYKDMPVYLLCVGAYVASDFALIHSYPGKMLKWGYFPDAGQGNDLSDGSEYMVMDYSPDDRTDSLPEAAGKPLRLCWAGRLIRLKHPEYAVRLAGKLKETGYDFEMDIVGSGSLCEELQTEISQNNLGGIVHMHGSKKPAEVLDYMRNADIFLFTSNFLEGWGAVVNEAMQCGCCVVASAEAGAVPFLINDGENGLVYHNGEYTDFENKVLSVIEDRGRISRLGSNARNTISSVWNARNTAAELIRFCKEYLDSGEAHPAKCGPMSVAEIIKPPGFFRTIADKSHLE